jgi:hypothetical protein
MKLILYILFVIIFVALIFYFFFKSTKNKENRRGTNTQYNKYENTENIKSYINGYYNIHSFIDDKPLLPYMFTHLSKDFISNDNCKWNINYLSNLNKYKLFLNNNPICIYMNDKKICLYKLNNSVDETSTKQSNDYKNEDCDKPTLCSTDSILDKIPSFNEDNSLFTINKLSENRITIQKNDKYICKINDEIQLTEEFNDNCIWLIN